MIDNFLISETPNIRTNDVYYVVIDPREFAIGYIDLIANTRFAKWAKDIYRSSELGHVKVTTGKKYEFLSIILNYSLTII